MEQPSKPAAEETHDTHSHISFGVSPRSLRPHDPTLQLHPHTKTSTRCSKTCCFRTDPNPLRTPATPYGLFPHRPKQTNQKHAEWSENLTPHLRCPTLLVKASSPIPKGVSRSFSPITLWQQHRKVEAVLRRITKPDRPLLVHNSCTWPSELTKSFKPQVGDPQKVMSYLGECTKQRQPTSKSHMLLKISYRAIHRGLRAAVATSCKTTSCALGTQGVKSGLQEPVLLFKHVNIHSSQPPARTHATTSTADDVNMLTLCTSFKWPNINLGWKIKTPNITVSRFT